MKKAGDAIKTVLSDSLTPLSFTANRDSFIRFGKDITQTVAAVHSRFSIPGHFSFWFEIVLIYGKPEKNSGRISDYRADKNAIASIRLDEICPDLPPYLMINSKAPFAGLRMARDTVENKLIPFLNKTQDPEGVIAVLQKSGAGRMQQLGVLCALIGDKDRSRLFFSNAPGDRKAIRQIARHYGVELDR